MAAGRRGDALLSVWMSVRIGVELPAAGLPLAAAGARRGEARAVWDGVANALNNEAGGPEWSSAEMMSRSEGCLQGDVAPDSTGGSASLSDCAVLGWVCCPACLSGGLASHRRTRCEIHLRRGRCGDRLRRLRRACSSRHGASTRANGGGWQSAEVARTNSACLPRHDPAESASRRSASIRMTSRWCPASTWGCRGRSKHVVLRSAMKKGSDGGGVPASSCVAAWIE